MKIPPEIAKQIANREKTARAAAIELGITEHYLCKLLKDQGIARIPGPTVIHREKMSALTEARRDFRKQLIRQVKNGSKTVTTAAKEAKCSERTIYRHLK